MSEIASLRQDGPFPEIRDAFTKKRTWILALVFFAVLIFAVRWPLAYEFSILCCFPAGLFVWAAVSSGAIHRPPMTKIVVAVVVLHCVLLTSTLYLWSKYPKGRTGDFALVFVVIEFAAIALLMYFARPRTEATGK